MPPRRRTPAVPAATSPGDARAVIALGPDDFLADRAVEAVVAAARAVDPATERREVDLSHDRAAGELSEALSPNLFGDAAVVVARGAQSADPAAVDVLVESVAAGLPDEVRLVVVHPGGVKGRAVADRLRKGGLLLVACDRPKGRAVDDFLRVELDRLGRTADPAAVGALRSALGDDLRLLAAAVHQLCSDVQDGQLTQDDVSTYYEGVADVPGYLISDAVWDGRSSEVVRRTRWALVNEPGIGPAVTSAVASGLRQLGRFTGAPAGMDENALAGFVGAPPWKLRALREQAGRWHPAALARSVGELAVADAAVKGRDAAGRVLPEAGLDRDQGTYALEQTLLRLVSRRG